jgi:hypothetical protein
MVYSNTFRSKKKPSEEEMSSLFALVSCYMKYNAVVVVVVLAGEQVPCSPFIGNMMNLYKHKF